MTEQSPSWEGPLPQRWAISPWGDTVWTYMAMWAPAKLQHLSEQLPSMEAPGSYGPPPNLAVMFHELGTLIGARFDPAPPPPSQQPWRTAISAPGPLRLVEPDGPTLVDPDPDSSLRPPPPPPEQTLPPLGYLDLPAPHDPRNTLIRAWTATAALVDHVLDLIWQADLYHSLLPLLPPEQQRLLQPETMPPAELLTPAEREHAHNLQQEIEGGFAELRSPEPSTQEWIFAVAAWHATLAIRYTPHDEPRPQLRLALISKLLHNPPMPARSLPCMPAGIPEATETLPIVPEVVLSAYARLLPDW
ncbi:MAG: hypothetical protein OXC00_15865 [Acidimicrobiaceae bacterium]|nr:hypothetical protein [Acidimicrobiaceae bacterium]